MEIYSKNIHILKVDTKSSPALHRETYFSHTPPMTSTRWTQNVQLIFLYDENSEI